MIANHENDTGQCQRRRIQFTFRHLILLFLVLSGVLALTTQFRHVGFAMSCFLVTAVAGWRLRKRRLMLAGITASCVFVITYSACWVQIGQLRVMDRHSYAMTQYALANVGEGLEEYAQDRGEYPDSLDDLVRAGNGRWPLDSSGRLSDGWGQPFDYGTTMEGFELTSLGRDGLRGGVGLDADISWSEAQTVGAIRVPLRQFLFDTPGSVSVFWMAVLASVAAGFVWHGVDQDPFLTTRWRLLGVLVTTISAALVAVFLAAFHVAASQSGH